jgi:sulfur-carrier protein adenylyltransferase/sulfurtransferase
MHSPASRSGTLNEAAFSAEESLRYARHFVLPEMGPEGQRKLKEARVLLVGAGGLGAPLALYLAAAGVGTLGLVDFDTVDTTNLQRQLLFGTRDVGRPKLAAAVERIADVNPHVEVVEHPVRLTSANALDIIRDYDIVADGTDNFPTRYLVNDACVLLRKPNVFGSVLRWEGQLSVFAVEGGPCYRCLFREPPPAGAVPDCAEGGVLGILPGIIGSLQALETVKLILGSGEPAVGRFLIFDALDLSWRELSLERNPDCPVCGDRPTQTELIDYELFCGVAAADGEGADAGGVEELEPDRLRALLESGRGGEAPFLLDVREPGEWEAMNLERFGACLIPLGELPERMDELPREREIVVYCLSGARSLLAVEALRDAGFQRAASLRGGIAAWLGEA